MAAAATIAKTRPSKWFPNKNALKLSLPLFRSKPTKLSNRSSSAHPHLLIKKSSSKEDEFQKVFHFFDSDGDGKLSGHELRAYFMSVGETISHEQAQRVITEFDRDGDDLLEFQDFVHLMEGDQIDSCENNIDDDLRRAFEVFKDDEVSGCITPKGLQLVLNRLGDEKSFEECAAMIKVFDLDGNGVLDFHEFNQMMT